MRSWVFLAFAAVSLVGCNTAAPSIPATLTINAVSGNNQIAASGSAVGTPLVIQVVSSSGAASGVSVAAFTDTRYCSISPATASTDTNGNASFTVTALAITGVTCNSNLTIVGQTVSRGTIAFNTFIRPAQRNLSLVSTLALPTATATVTDAGAATGSVNISAASNLPTPDSNHTYGIYMARQDINGNISNVSLLGKSSSFPLPAALAAPTNLATNGNNVLAIVLQAIGAGRVNDLNNATLVTAFTPVAAGTANVAMTLSAEGLRLPTAYTVSSASAQVTLTNPNINLGVAGDGISVAWTGLPVNPSGWVYVLNTTDAASVSTRVATFNSNGRNGTSNFNAQAPSNSTIPSSIVDAKDKFSRVFVTLEPLSAGDGGFASSTTGATVVLDNATSLWTLSTNNTQQ